MAAQSGWISLESVVNDYLDRSEQSNHKYFKCWNIAFGLMDELGLDFFYQVRSLPVIVDANKTAQIPSEMINWTKVGLMDSSGQVIVLGSNSKYSNYAAALPNRISDLGAASVASTVYSPSNPNFYNYSDGNGFGNLYGSFGNGSFKVDGNTILLDPQFAYSTIIVEGVVAPSQDEEYYVPMVFREAFIAGIGWKDIQFIQNSRRGGNGAIEQRKQAYYNERRLAQSRYKPFSLDEAYSSSIQNMLI